MSRCERRRDRRDHGDYVWKTRVLRERGVQGVCAVVGHNRLYSGLRRNRQPVRYCVHHPRRRGAQGDGRAAHGGCGCERRRERACDRGAGREPDDRGQYPAMGFNGEEVEERAGNRLDTELCIRQSERQSPDRLAGAYRRRRSNGHRRGGAGDQLREEDRRRDGCRSKDLHIFAARAERGVNERRNAEGGIDQMGDGQADGHRAPGNRGNKES